MVGISGAVVAAPYQKTLRDLFGIFNSTTLPRRVVLVKVITTTLRQALRALHMAQDFPMREPCIRN